VLDTLTMARERFPGQRNSLDALCRRLGVDNAHRKLHGALLDAELLTEVYLSLTAGQGALGLNHAEAAPPTGGESFTTSTLPTQRPRLLLANADEQAAHLTRLAKIAGKAGRVLWSPEEIK
jgi:DNA polymerase-3 subunit epsilon